MHGIEDSKRAATLRAIWPAVLHAMRGNPPGDRRRPRALHLETTGEPAVRLRPRHLGGHHAMLRARHARRQAHELDPIAAEVLVAPSPFAATPPI